MTFAIPAARLAGKPTIWYIPPERTVKLEGPASVIGQAKTRLETVLKTTYRWVGLQQIIRTRSKWSNDLANSKASASKVSVGGNIDHKPSDQIFSLRANEEDGVLVALWNKHILPALPGILGPRLGDTYSASLVRIGNSEPSTRAYVRIQSEYGQSRGIQAQIRKAINAICDAHGKHHLVFRFYVGAVALLAGSPIEDISDDDNSDDGEGDVCEFPWYKRWWEKPGMGASIGLRCSSFVSATLGGYVFVDDEPYILTVDHFIDKARSHINGTPASLLDQSAITSPSLLDVEEMVADLQQSYHKVEADIDNYIGKLGPQEASVIQGLLESDASLRSWINCLDVWSTLLQELPKNEREYDLGKVTHRCGLKVRKPLSCNETPLLDIQNDVVHRMDWALCKVNSARWGDNRHRYRSDKDTTNTDYLSPSTHALGDGELCQEACDPEPHTPIYFVGQKSSLHYGRISPSLTDVHMDGMSTQEWSVIVQHQVAEKDIVAGDSGAWILRENDHHVVGQLWGWQDGLLLFTPIKVVFADIMESVGTRNVSLQHRYVNPETLVIRNDSTMKNTADLICEHRELKQRKPKEYKIPSILLSAAQIGPQIVGFRSLLSKFTATASSIHRKEVLSAKASTVDIVPGSPVPSLTSSLSSSPGPDSELYHEIETEHLPLNEMGIPTLLVEHPVMIRTESYDESMTVSDEQASSPYNMQVSNDRPSKDVVEKINKHSLRFILRDAKPDPKAMRTLPDIYSFTGFRKAGTFPVWNRPLTSQTQTSITAIA